MITIRSLNRLVSCSRKRQYLMLSFYSRLDKCICTSLSTFSPLYPPTHPVACLLCCVVPFSVFFLKACSFLIVPFCAFVFMSHQLLRVKWNAIEFFKCPALRRERQPNGHFRCFVRRPFPFFAFSFHPFPYGSFLFVNFRWFMSRKHVKSKSRSMKFPIVKSILCLMFRLKNRTFLNSVLSIALRSFISLEPWPINSAKTKQKTPNHKNSTYRWVL